MTRDLAAAAAGLARAADQLRMLHLAERLSGRRLITDVDLVHFIDQAATFRVEKQFILIDALLGGARR